MDKYKGEFYSVEDHYPPDNTKVIALIEGKEIEATFRDYPEARSWTISRDDYDGVYLPTHWRFPYGVCAVFVPFKAKTDSK